VVEKNPRQESPYAQAVLRHFSTTNQGNQMTKALTKAQQIRSYVAANPNAKPKDIAKTLGVGLQYVYSVMWTAKKKAAKKRITITATQAMLAKKAGIPLVEYAKSLMEAQKKKVGRPRKVEEKPLIMEYIPPAPMQIEMFEPTPDPVNHPAHYKVGGIETIDFIEAKKLGYNLGNVVKYLTRADHKGNKLEDLRKAQWYLTREINSLK
jgi:hypothetical protein